MNADILQLQMTSASAHFTLLFKLELLFDIAFLTLTLLVSCVRILVLLQVEIIWASSRENWSSVFANNKGARQPAHPRRLISAFVICFLESIISKLDRFCRDKANFDPDLVIFRTQREITCNQCL